MTKRYAILRKKLRELESELVQVFALPTETPCHQLLSEGIEQRFLFLTNLLSAEVASNPSKPHHLRHIAQRLIELETAFRNWDNYTTLVVHNFDTASTCSCSQSCLNDDGEVLPGPGSPVYDAPKTYYEAVAEEKVPAEEMVKLESEREVKEEEGSDWVWRYCWVMSTGVMLGAVCMGFVMVGFSGCFQYIEHEGLLPPT
ncbi:unnamed protein product [Ilex paraguariensis]|uniref:DUF7610 domain-containing protein n=1 Tax=Ilex paraguariensis TaxID=185542 RepID=A0ABC8SV64_9AQUA